MQARPSHQATIATLAANALAEEIGIKDPTRCVYCGDPAEFVCDDCDAIAAAKNAIMASEIKQEREALRANSFSSRIPEDYQDNDMTRLPKWAGEILALWNPQDRYGVTIIGPAESGKTRTAVEILKRAFAARREIEFKQAGELRRAINKMAREGDDSKALGELATVPVLAIDDLGNQAWTETSEEFYLALLESRCGKRNPTIVTSQFPSDDFIGKTTNRRVGIAIARRIGPEFSWIVDTKLGLVQPPKTPAKYNRQ